MKHVSRNYSPERVDNILSALLQHPEAYAGSVEPKRQKPRPSSPTQPDDPPNQPQRQDPEPFPKYEDEPPVTTTDELN
jgi:hypothetical protein